MIAMLIADNPEAERKRLLEESRWQAARLTEDEWQWMECGSLQELSQVISADRKLDIMCIDITMQTTDQILSATEKLRNANPAAHMILIANSRISPVRYMRPSISAQSLMLKPLDNESVKSVLAESISSYVSKFSDENEDSCFVVETRGERELIPYSRILYFEAREKKVFVNTGEMEYPFYDTLDHLEERLSEKFLRCHRSFLVNRKKISRVYLSRNIMVLSGGEEMPLSRSYKSSIKEFMSGRDTGRIQEAE